MTALPNAMKGRFAGPAVALGLFCAGLSGVIIAELTHLGRAIAGALIVGICVGALVGFAPDRHRAILRMAIGLGGTIFAVPWAAISAYFNDAIYGVLAQDRISPPAPGVFDDRLAGGMALAWIGTIIGVALLIWATVLHVRVTRNADR